MARDPRYANVLGQLDPRWDAERTERALAALHRRRARRRASAVLAAIVVAASAGGVTAWSWAGEGSAPQVERAREDRVVRLADGSRITPDEGADVIVERVTETRVSVRVERGAASIEVVPGQPRRFEVTVGAVTVTVLGTRFRVERLDRERAHVSVTRGHVAVAWASGRTELRAGDEGTFPRASADERAAASAPSHAGELMPAEAVQEEVVQQEAAAEPPARPPGRRSDWRHLARTTRYDDAYRAFHASADATREVANTVDDLLLAADVARLSGHPAEALPWLQRVERDHGRDPRAVLAAFTRGRILMELGRASEAAAQLERVLSMEPSGSLAEDATARAALAHSTAGETARAAALAADYLEAHPEGRWATRMRAIGRATPAPE